MKWPQIGGTLRLVADEKRESAAVEEASRLLLQGGLVAFPTETVYGLGAALYDEGAIQKVFQVKKRPGDNPFIVHIYHMEQLRELTVDLPPQALHLAAGFWPGPLTLICRRSPRVPDLATAHLETVAIRLPDHPLALNLLRRFGLPLVGPSANLSGRPSPTTAEHVLQDLAGAISAVLDGGACPVGVESTVLDLSISSSRPHLLRPGAVTREQLESFLGMEIEQASFWQEGQVATPPSPGMKYRHYAPRIPLVLIEGEDMSEILCRLLWEENRYKGKGVAVGFLVSAETAANLLLSDRGRRVEILGSRHHPAGIAERLYDALRRLDEAKIGLILAEGYREEELGTAVMNRLRKAATQVHRVTAPRR